MWQQPVLEQADDADAGDGRIDCQVGAAAHAHEEWPGGLDLHYLASPLEFPGRHRAALEAPPQARMSQQLPRMLRPTRALEVGRGCRGREALRTGSDRHRDHVLLQAFVIADPGIE